MKALYATVSLFVLAVLFAACSAVCPISPVQLPGCPTPVPTVRPTPAPTQVFQTS